ncbi:hypothetical protein CHS0354_013980 [Potamilus streckersoni]|uniref:Uncharacterized protein n=1 Tax=Potamilus streckersoni TaxID=2493646 RepID=A0AAE0WGF6_9BIVA|nr:hypothetical protein CHS0354_013980 [Potamilus streckersoni]
MGYTISIIIGHEQPWSIQLGSSSDMMDNQRRPPHVKGSINVKNIFYLMEWYLYHASVLYSCVMSNREIWRVSGYTHRIVITYGINRHFHFTNIFQNGMSSWSIHKGAWNVVKSNFKGHLAYIGLNTCCGYQNRLWKERCII